MLGTAGFFLAAGVILGLLAFAIIRIEKRMKEPRLRKERGMMSGKRLVIAAVLLAAVQIGFLSWIIAGRAAILRDGQEVLLKVEPIDPRDFLRGDYVRLGYEIRNVPVKLIENAPAGRIRHRGRADLRPPEEGRGRLLARSLGVVRNTFRARLRKPAKSISAALSPAAGPSDPTLRSASTTASTATMCRKARGWRSSRT